MARSAIILAGGLGERMRPLTNITPKPLIKVYNLSIIEYQISLLQKLNITHLTLALSYKPETYLEFIKEKNYPFKISISLEKDPLGTGGAIAQAINFTPGEDIIIFNGDIITDLDLKPVIKYYHTQKLDFLLTLKRSATPEKFGQVILEDNKIKEFKEKSNPPISNLINQGIYLAKKEFLKNIKSERNSLEKDFFPEYIDYLTPYICKSNYWIDLASPEKIIKLQEDILEGKIRPEILTSKFTQGQLHQEDRKYISKTLLNKNLEISHSSLGEKVKIGRNAKILNSTIGDNVTIEDNASIINSFVSSNSTVKSGIHIGQYIGY